MDSKQISDKIACPHCNGTGQIETDWACVVDEVNDPTCVLDFDRPQDCVFATPGGVRTDCKYWQRIKVGGHD